MKTFYVQCFCSVLFFLGFQPTAEAQILQTHNEIVDTYGIPFYEGITENGEKFLYYKIPVKTETSGIYNQRKLMFFKKSEDGTEICYKWKVLEPSSELKLNVTSFNRNLVQIGDKKWKDYGKSIVYELQKVNGVCAITAWYDSEVELAKVYKL